MSKPNENKAGVLGILSEDALSSLMGFESDADRDPYKNESDDHDPSEMQDDEID